MTMTRKNLVWTVAIVAGLLLCWAVNARAQNVVRSAGSDHTKGYVLSNATAQGVAEMMANAGACRHFGGNSGYEGVGMSSAGPDAALAACCYSRSGMRVVDQGVAYRNGRWYACKRYARR